MKTFSLKGKANAGETAAVHDAEIGAGIPAPIFPYVYRWDRQKRKGQRCRMLTRSVSMNSCLLEFEDGHQMVTSRNAVSRAPEHRDSIARGKKGTVSPSSDNAATLPTPAQPAARGQL